MIDERTLEQVMKDVQLTMDMAAAFSNTPEPFKSRAIMNQILPILEHAVDRVKILQNKSLESSELK